MLCFSAVILLLGAVLTAQANVPQLINYQGVLLDSNGDPVTTQVSVVFTIYDDPNVGTSQWTETRNVTPDANGGFSILLGQVSPIGDAVFDAPDRWLGIKVGADPEMTPRAQIVTVAYAHRIATVDGSTGGIISGDVDIQSDLDLNGDLQVTGKATIGPGHTNTGTNAFVAGRENTVNSPYVTVGGGYDNTASMDFATVGGGYSNVASNQRATVGGGSNNNARGIYSVVSGGGGEFDSNNAFGDYSAVGGGSMNFAIGAFSSVPGGNENRAEGDWSAIGGGARNVARNIYNTIAGGYENRVDWTGATIGGGENNVCSTFYATVSGGIGNNISWGGNRGTIGGGDGNMVSGYYGTVAGGHYDTASDFYTAIGGGLYNVASDYAATVAGGNNNRAIGENATVPGGKHNTANHRAFAAGNIAKANHDGSVVIAANSEWGDADSIRSGGDEQMVLRADGGLYITNTAEKAPYNSTNIITTRGGAYLKGIGTDWTNSSDRNKKENFAPLNRKELLEKIAALPISRWNYKEENPVVQHIGPVAQDFNALFNVGADDKSISTIDPAGIALAAIQELYQQNTDLKKQVEELEALVQQLLAERQ